MAAPADMTTKNIGGVWVMNKSLSDDTDDLLAAQNIGWVLRRGIGMATITLTIKHFADPDTSAERIIVNQSLSGLNGTVEERTLDWAERPREDYVFGKVIGKTRRINLSEIPDEKLKEGWTEDSIEHGLIYSHVVNSTYQWTAEQIWGFMIVDGVRRHARRVKLTTPKVRLDKVLVYDWTKSN
ncbi:hypothetical protein BDZ91DRAFT_720671 [Kalaharituber pfeilii]|nr:hypothetical protein BDZ91DRAFT_720671 [Kalaharituber pfeilii]